MIESKDFIQSCNLNKEVNFGQNPMSPNALERIVSGGCMIQAPIERFGGVTTFLIEAPYSSISLPKNQHVINQVSPQSQPLLPVPVI